MRPDFWKVAPEWRGETVAILAGGPSMSLCVAHAACSSGWRTIAINNSWELAPGADLLWFCDGKWWDWHGARALTGFRGPIATLENLEIAHARVRHLRNYDHCAPVAGPLWTDPPDGVIAGHNSGYQAINLAVLLGAARIVLLGYDMRFVNGRSHWHGGHPTLNDPNAYAQRLMPRFRALAPVLAKRGVEVLNATPGSALDVFERVSLESLLSDPGRAALSA